ncbi:hypothetical protein MMC06_002879 [Schaereria dolodes]|nr:hypothetical protein [Schaereria dolodes]
MSFSNNKFNHSSPLNGRSAPIYEQDPTPLTPRAEGTESTVSTTAPSTVWDVVDDMNSRLRNEVDDLNSRLRKLELTGKLPSSSGAAVSNAVRERPRTATTTVTTMSPSPHGRRTTSTSPEASTIGGPNASNTHPLLQAALAKSKTSMSPTMFKALEATAADASALSAMMASPNQNGSNYDGTSVIDRRLKRKADNMCRSLTELCIAMTENPLQHDAPSVEDGLETSTQSFFSGQQQREGNTDPNRFKRGGSLEPDARPSSRVFSRIEARRTSLLGMNSVKYRASSPNDYSSDAATPVQHAIPTANALHRIPTVLLRSRRKDSNDTERKRPPLSRAMTSLDDVRPLPPQHGSREYTSQHPLPSPDPRSPSVQSSLPVRKSYFNGVSHVPSSPMVQPGSRRYLERSTTSAAESARLAEARQQRIKALGQYGSLGRQRDSSLSRRLRHAAVDSGNHNAEANSQ